MKFIKNALLAIMLGISMLGFAGCSNVPAETTEDSASQDEPAAPDQVGGVSLENPIVVDKEAKTVTVLTQVNGKYFTEVTRHASVFKDGTNGAKSVFTAYADPVMLYDALVEIGAEPGNNMTVDNGATTHVEGTALDMKVTWNGAEKEYDVNEVIKDSNGKQIAFKFGGNLEMAKNKNTGCLSCLDSCPVGIISNSTYTYGSVEKTSEVTFMGNGDILPEDGTYIATVYSIAE
ncbi:YdjY domain-containing protein [Acetoanaerobium sticklandii]|uniref:YdjY domain-containing protein n=1 Tax=Acetoanaerobium sticklandii TaxID=1511 RepID=UPI003A8D0C54